MFRGTRSGKYYQKQSKLQVNAEEQVEVQVLKDQINSLFDMLASSVSAAKSGNADQKGLLRLNDCTVASLKLFGKCCQGHKAKREENILCAVYAHYEGKQARIKSADKKLIAPFLQYMEAALTAAGPLPKLKISQQTINVAKRDTLRVLPDIFNKFLGANHETEAQMDEVRRNVPRYKQQNDAAVESTKQRFHQKQKTAQYPSQNDMYALSGGGKNKQFGSSLHSFGKYAQQMADDGDDAKHMDVEQDDGYGLPNAYIIAAPPQRFKESVEIPYPMPCEIKKQLSQHEVGVVMAAPFGIKAKISIANIERDQEKVRAMERRYIQRVLAGKGGLGYPSIDDGDEYQ